MLILIKLKGVILAIVVDFQLPTKSTINTLLLFERPDVSALDLLTILHAVFIWSVKIIILLYIIIFKIELKYNLKFTF